MIKSSSDSKSDKSGDDANQASSPTYDKLTEPINHESLQSAWDEYIEKLKKNGNMVNVVALEKSIELKNNHEVHITISNELELDRIKTLRGDLLGFLRNKLRNGKIDLVTSINKEIQSKKAFTNVEKYEEMRKKNPAIEELKNRLGLEF